MNRRGGWAELWGLKAPKQAREKRKRRQVPKPRPAEMKGWLKRARPAANSKYLPGQHIFKAVSYTHLTLPTICSV
eukprot:4024449-Alexandrium_andersonii.AAC.1